MAGGSGIGGFVVAFILGAVIGYTIAKGKGAIQIPPISGVGTPSSGGYQTYVPNQ
jgi:hypothetical protein